MEIHRLQKQEIYNKGVGYVTNDLICKNDVILQENVTVIVPKRYRSYEEVAFRLFRLIYENKKTRAMFEKFVPHEIDDITISTAELTKILSNIENNKLRNYLNQFNIYDISIYYEKIRRNVFDFKGNMFLIFKGTLFNHSCDPNVDYDYDPISKKIIFHAIKDIQPEEELTIMYVDTNRIPDPTNFFYNAYGFNCNCETCNRYAKTE